MTLDDEPRALSLSIVSTVIQTSNHKGIEFFIVMADYYEHRVFHRHLSKINNHYRHRERWFTSTSEKSSFGAFDLFFLPVKIYRFAFWLADSFLPKNATPVLMLVLTWSPILQIIRQLTHPKEIFKTISQIKQLCKIIKKTFVASLTWIVKWTSERSERVSKNVKTPHNSWITYQPWSNTNHEVISILDLTFLLFYIFAMTLYLASRYLASRILWTTPEIFGYMIWYGATETCRNGGGVAIYIQSNISFFNRNKSKSRSKPFLVME